jgi:uncharacterized damage-inducible protein DinB
MAISESLLPEFDQEMDGARRTLERVPEDKLGWKPHDKSGSMGWLAGHVASIPTWASAALNQDSLDLEPEGKPYVPPPDPTSVKEMLESFDKNVAEARAAIAAAGDAKMGESWSLLRNGKEMMKMPRVAVIRGFVLNHLIHHRAQLGVYLRLNDIPVPSIYGPSADENPMGM